MSLGDKNRSLAVRLRRLFDTHSDTRANPDILEAANLLDRPVSSIAPTQNEFLTLLDDLEGTIAAKDTVGYDTDELSKLDAEHQGLRKRLLALFAAAQEATYPPIPSTPSATPRSDGMPLLFNVFNMICQDRDEDWKEQWRELMKEIELVLTRAGYTMPKAGGDYAVAAPIRPTDDGAEK